MILKMDTLQLENDLVKDHSRDNVIIISDPEDGEINDDSNLEDITDISSGEEKYLKERIKILEALDTALEKKEARRLSSLFISESHLVKPAVNIESLSDISSNAEDVIIVKNDENIKSNFKANKLNKRKRKLRPRSAIVKPHVNKKARRKITDPVKNESSSSESDDEKAHQRRRLRNAVRISPIGKTQKSSLKSRLLNMIKAPEIAQNTNEIENISGLPEESKLNDKDKITSVTDCLQYEALCSSDDDPEVLRQLALESKSSRNIKITELNQDHVSDVKLDEHDKNIDKITHITDDIDSDTAELRTIALKSAMLKKAMERKKLKKTERKKQLKLRRSITTTFSDDALEKAIDFSPLSVILNEPETDIEAVDMEINDDINDSPIYENNIPSAHNIMFGQTQDNLAYQQQQMPEVYDDYHYGEYSPQPCDHYLYNNYYDNNLVADSIQHNNNTLDKIDKQPIIRRDEDNDEDETLLRAQLLSSMSKNVRTLSSKPIASNQEDSFKSEIKEVAKPPDSNFVIKLADSDFDSECEATRNLITMHNKLKNQGEFEKNLEAFLKSARTKVENQLPTGQEYVSSQLNHTPMAVKHLPVSHQQEYRQLIKRMAELDKVRQARKLVLENSIKISQLNTKLYPSKETLKSINGKNILMEMSNMLHTSTDNTQALSEQQIAISRLYFRNLKSLH